MLNNNTQTDDCQDRKLISYKSLMKIERNYRTDHNDY